MKRPQELGERSEAPGECDVPLSQAALSCEVQLPHTASLFDAHRKEEPSTELRQRLYAIECDFRPHKRLTSWRVGIASITAVAAAAAAWFGTPRSHQLGIRPEPTMTVSEPATTTSSLTKPSLYRTTSAPSPSAAAHTAPAIPPVPVSRPTGDDEPPQATLGESRAGSSLSLEFDSLRRAREALGVGNTSAALRELDRYERSGGLQLRTEAALLRIEALSKRGDKRTAAKLAAQFVYRHPNSPLVDRARVFLAP